MNCMRDYPSFGLYRPKARLRNHNRNICIRVWASIYLSMQSAQVYLEGNASLNNPDCLRLFIIGDPKPLHHISVIEIMSIGLPKQIVNETGCRIWMNQDFFNRLYSAET